MVSIKQLDKQELEEMSLTEIAYEILSEKKQPLPFRELLDEVAALLGMPEEKKEEIAAQFYTDLNIEGKFLNIGGNTWGIKSWFPVDQIEDEIVPTVRSKKKAKLDEDEGLDDLDQYEEEDLAYEEELDEYDELDEDYLDDDDVLDPEAEDEDFPAGLDDEDEDLLLDEDLDDDLLIGGEEEEE
ncbi:DNA-directed RNA polymerase subunit delta [Caldibacillus debilis]|uniref:DNA-directed RNA polymerase subunit delta n=1 Tax=Caldibacillus debilis TaxID=301148 RepID=UPI0023F3858B|nr:DNA-directed RNA polymerase subunit delta [Caldibacillus debilis]